MTGAMAFDTSNYTTSTAYFSPEGALQARKLLDVPPGALGLRQSDALFQHVRRLPQMVEELYAQNPGEIRAVGASTAPREAEGSYMPCFLAGEGQGRVTAQVLNVPFYPWSHQQGHLAAAAWSAGREDVLQAPFWAWHLSGGTTELLAVTPKGRAFTAQKVGGTQDLSAGQLIDRTGQLLGLPFPSGKALDALARAGQNTVPPFPVKVKDLTFSLSGMENQVKALAEAGTSQEEIACFVLNTLTGLVRRATDAALALHPDWPVLFSGGVSSNSILREGLSGHNALFSAPAYALDNALGVALLTYRAWEADYGN